MSHVGIVIRPGKLAEGNVSIGGIGCVATAPAARGRGLASRGMTMALDFLREHEVHFGLLVCRDEMVPFYERQGWRVFNEPVSISQFSRRVRFSLSPVMVQELEPGLMLRGEVNL